MRKTLALLFALCIIIAPLGAFQSGVSGGGVRVQGSVATNDCVKFISKSTVASAGAACGTGSGSGTVTNTGTLTANAVVIGNGTTDIKVLAALGSSGDVLTSNGAGSAPSFQTSTGLSSATVTLSAAEILDLVNTPKQLLAAPGANKFYRVVSADLVYLAGSHPYGDAGNTRAFITFIDPAAVNATEFDIGNWFSQATNRLNQAVVYNDNANGGNNSDPLVDSVNKPLLLTGEGSGLIGGPIVTSALGAGGSGYAANDVGTIDGGTGGTYEVLTVNGGGAVQTYSITAAGLAYPTGVKTTAPTSGGGDGAFTINVTSVQTGNGTAVLFLSYRTQTLP